MFGRSSLLIIVYLVIGVVVAASKDYFDGIDNIEGVISAALGIVLWPLLLLDVNLRIGRLDDDGRRRGVLLWLPALARSAKTILGAFNSRTQTYGVNRTGSLLSFDLFRGEGLPCYRNGPRRGEPHRRASGRKGDQP
jgi:hypothetical protein